MSSVRRGAGIVPALVLLLAGLLAGCRGGSDGPAAAGALPRYTSLTDLAAATSAQQKADKTANISLSGALSGQTDSAISGDGAMRYDADGPAMQLTQRISAGGGAPTELALVVLPDTAYVRPPADGPTGLPPGKHWVHITQNPSDPKSAQFAKLVQAIRDNADPTRSFSQFGDAISIVDSAEEQLDGAPTMRYRLRVDLAKAAQQQQDPTMKQSLEQSVQNGLSTLDYLMWLDAANRLTRVLVDQTLPQNQGEFTLDTHYRDWGKPVTIEKPPADEVVDR